ncbi:MAG: gamma-glutamyltransferase [Congregibacter sp.]
MLIGVLSGCSQPDGSADSPAPLTDRAVATTQAAIASPETHATQAGLDVLQRGGNAVDAATAVAFTLAVTLPDAGNIGGGGFMMLYMDGQPAFLDYRETAPAQAYRDMYLDKKGQLSGDASLTGHKASGVPGTVAGLWAAHQRYGTVAWASLLAPAIKLARLGFVPEPWLLKAIQNENERLQPRTNFSAYFGAAEQGKRFVQPELADTLQRIADKGSAGFYEGQTATLLAAEMQRGGGLITEQDLKSYQPRWRAPLVTDWRGYRLLTAPLPSSGGFAIAQYLRMRDLRAADFDGLPHNSAQYIHLKAEIEKRIFADRARYLGDPDFVEVPFAKLLDEARLAERARDINAQGISSTEAVIAVREPVHTTHFSILDGQGNAVSNTYTLNTDFGSGVVVTGAGFLLNNEMDDFSAAPGQANYYGVVGDEANAIAAGKRMLSSMSPTVLLRDDDVAMVLGAMGGSTIFTTVYQIISNIVVFSMNAEQAQAATRVHHQLLPRDLITYSPTTPLAQGTILDLRKRGYQVAAHDYEFGNVQLIWDDPEAGLQAVSDPRFTGSSAVLMLPSGMSPESAPQD